MDGWLEWRDKPFSSPNPQPSSSSTSTWYHYFEDGDFYY